MTTDELRKYFNEVYGIQPWPITFEVTAETYGNVCQELFNYWYTGGETIAPVKLGMNGGVLFKGVELIVGDFNNTLNKELLDLITLMPDSQTQLILDYIHELRATRKMRDADSPPDGE